MTAAAPAQDHLWLPFTPNRHFHHQPRVMVKADGMHFTTQEGQQVLDGIGCFVKIGSGGRGQILRWGRRSSGVL